MAEPTPPDPPAPPASVTPSGEPAVDAHGTVGAPAEAGEVAGPSVDEAEPLVLSPCPNCGAAPADGLFCPACGQRRISERMTLGGLWRNFASRTFNLDHGLLHTLARLAGGPGRVPDDYVAGRQRRYTHPLSFYLLTATVSLFVTGFYTTVVLEQLDEVQSAVVQIDLGEDDATEPPGGSTADAVPTDSSAVHLSPRDRLVGTLTRIEGDDGRGIVRQLSQISTRIGTPGLVFFALFLVLPLRLMFGKRRNLAETTVFSLYVVGFATFITALVSLAALLLPSADTTALTASFATVAVYPAVTAWGAVAFWQPGWASIAKALVAGVIGYFVYGVVTSALSLLIFLDGVLDEAGLRWADLLTL